MLCRMLCRARRRKYCTSASCFTFSVSVSAFVGEFVQLCVCVFCVCVLVSVDTCRIVRAVCVVSGTDWLNPESFEIASTVV